MRKVIYEMLNRDSELEDVVGDRIFTSSGLDGTDDQSNVQRPFIVFKIAGGFPGMSTIKQESLEVWIHDEVGSYTTIDDIIKIIKRILSQTQVKVGDAWLMESQWTSDSPDLFDDVRRTNTRMTSFNLVGTGE